MRKFTAIVLVAGLWLSLIPDFVSGQTQTVGLFTYNDTLATPGYTLFPAPRDYRVYLLDNCGDVVNTWEGISGGGASAYLKEDGNLLRCAVDTGGVFFKGGRGGWVEEYDWDGNLLWRYDYSTNDYAQHHDIELLPNGNILILAWVKYDSLTSLAAGRDPLKMEDGEVWGERVIEVRPIYPDSAEIVWQWDLWDHLVQDYDSTKSNYGVIADNPRKWDLNYLGDQPTGDHDWIHMNAVGYNADLDQIILSSRTMYEIYIIDHSTTTSEAAGSTGGQWGHGGDILFRYGNPEAYGRGTPQDLTLWSQHNPTWIENGYLDEGKIMIFNNGLGRGYSSVDVIDPATDSAGNYLLSPGQPFGPVSLDWEYKDTTRFYSAFISGSNRLANGNTMICSGLEGRLFEVTPQKEIVWEYVSPVCVTTLLAQGDTIPENSYSLPGLDNMVFRCKRYHTWYPAFRGKVLVPQGPLELDPFPSVCNTPIGVEEELDREVTVYPNPASGNFRVKLTGGQEARVEVFNLMGQVLYAGSTMQGSVEVPADGWKSGVYLVRVGDMTQKLVLSR